MIKNGADGIFYRDKTEDFIVDIESVEHVIDTTSAGDAFNSGYLNAQMNGYNAADAIKQASRLSACVIQHKGAIISRDAFNDFMARQNH